jgi:hypothetical protein
LQIDEAKSRMGEGKWRSLLKGSRWKSQEGGSHETALAQDDQVSHRESQQVTETINPIVIKIQNSQQEASNHLGILEESHQSPVTVKEPQQNMEPSNGVYTEATSRQLSSPQKSQQATLSKHAVIKTDLSSSTVPIQKTWQNTTSSSAVTSTKPSTLAQLAPESQQNVGSDNVVVPIPDWKTLAPPVYSELKLEKTSPVALQQKVNPNAISSRPPVAVVAPKLNVAILGIDDDEDDWQQVSQLLCPAYYSAYS